MVKTYHRGSQEHLLPLSSRDFCRMLDRCLIQVAELENLDIRISELHVTLLANV